MKNTNKFQLMLAPIEDMTDNAFRTLCYNHGADLTFTELIKLDGLARSSAETWERIRLHDETPTIIQILGENENQLKKFLSRFEPQKGFMGFNLNLGCPNPIAVKQGQGCAMITRIAKTDKMIKIIKNYGYECSIKMRLGKDKEEKKQKVYLKLIKSTKADYYIVHARHGLQNYNEPADSRVYPECVNTGKIIIANGDIENRQQVQKLREQGLNGVMIGRAAIKNPTIFSEIKEKQKIDKEKIEKEYLELAEKYNSPYRYRKNVFKWITGCSKE